jgi:hypothetical protein
MYVGREVAGSIVIVMLGEWVGRWPETIVIVFNLCVVKEWQRLFVCVGGSGQEQCLFILCVGREVARKIYHLYFC